MESKYFNKPTLEIHKALMIENCYSVKYFVDSTIYSKNNKALEQTLLLRILSYKGRYDGDENCFNKEFKLDDFQTKIR